MKKPILRISIIAGYFLFLFTLIPIMGNTQEKEEISAIESKIQMITGYLARKYNVQCVYKSIPENQSLSYLYENATEKDYRKLLDYLKIFYQEVSKYPRNYFSDKEIKYIFFVKKLFLKENPAEGIYSYKEKYIYLDFSRNKGNLLSKRHSIHHEFYHMMDIMQPGWKNPTWNTFNHPEFEYGNNSVKNGNKERGKTYKIFRERKGFITPYSMMSEEEDKAEIYACLMVKSQSDILHRWIKDDPILGKKMHYIKERIQAFCPQMNEQYWDQLFTKE